MADRMEEFAQEIDRRADKLRDELGTFVSARMVGDTRYVEAKIEYLKRWIADYESLAAQARARVGPVT